jgi:hypothetical protein
LASCFSATIIAGSVLKLAISAGALPLSLALSRALLWLATIDVDQQTRTDRFGELEAYLHDEIGDRHEQGYPSSQIAFHILWRRMVREVPAELAWWVERHALAVGRRSLVVLTFGTVFFTACSGTFLAERIGMVLSYQPVSPPATVIEGTCIGGWVIGFGLMVRGLVGLHLVFYSRV